MHVENIKVAIRLMENAKNLDMRQFQLDPVVGDFPLQGDEIATSVEALHSCGNTACFAGYLALSPEFQAAGGYQSYNGAPRIRVNVSADDYEGVLVATDSTAVAEFLGISRSLAVAIVFGDAAVDDDPAAVNPYPVPFAEVKPEHVIEILNKILAGELQ